jgi:hypothetical protein
MTTMEESDSEFVVPIDSSSIDSSWPSVALASGPSRSDDLDRT